MNVFSSSVLNSHQFNHIDLSNERYLEKYNKNAFLFSHNLVAHSLLQLSSLQDLVLRLPQHQIFYNSGKINNTEDLDLAHKLHKTGLTLKETIQNIDNSGSFIMVRSPELDKEYKPLFQELLGDIVEFTKNIDANISNATLYLFIASPESVTPFHIDRYSTFLFQLQGTKDVYVWEPWNRDLITDMEIESYFARTSERGPSLKPGYENKSTAYTISPGQGVHIPFVAPHWVKNGLDASVSLSIIFNSSTTTKLADALLFNNKLRNIFGLNPTPVNSSPWKDSMKSIGYKGIKNVRRLLK